MKKNKIWLGMFFSAFILVGIAMLSVYLRIGVNQKEEFAILLVLGTMFSTIPLIPMFTDVFEIKEGIGAKIVIVIIGLVFLTLGCVFWYVMFLPLHTLSLKAILLENFFGVIVAFLFIICGIIIVVSGIVIKTSGVKNIDNHENIKIEEKMEE